MTRKITFGQTKRFDKEGFSGNVYIDGSDQQGFNALLVDVHGRHPKKRILEGNTRSYFVVKGSGTLTLDGEAQEINEGDLFVISAGSEYEYSGNMTLFEFNVSPDNTFKDKRI